MSTEPKKPRSDKGTKRPNPAAKLAELTIYMDASIDVLQAIIETTLRDPNGTFHPTFNDGQLAALRAVKARLA